MQDQLPPVGTIRPDTHLPPLRSNHRQDGSLMWPWSTIQALKAELHYYIGRTKCRIHIHNLIAYGNEVICLRCHRRADTPPSERWLRSHGIDRH